MRAILILFFAIAMDYIAFYAGIDPAEYISDDLAKLVGTLFLVYFVMDVAEFIKKISSNDK